MSNSSSCSGIIISITKSNGDIRTYYTIINFDKPILFYFIFFKSELLVIIVINTITRPCIRSSSGYVCRGIKNKYYYY